MDATTFDVLFFYCIWLINDSLFFLGFKNKYMFNFVHSIFPVALTIPNILKKQYVFQAAIIITTVAINLLLINKYLVTISYLVCYIFLLKKILNYSRKSSKFRIKIPMYVPVLLTVVFTHLIFIIGHGNHDWANSIYLPSFLWLFRIILITSLMIGHIYLRKFFFNEP